MSQHYLLYGHGGSFNHGGEAITRTTIELLRRCSPGCRITLSTHFAEQDILFSVGADEYIERNLRGKTNEEIYAPTLECITPETICIHLGGDNYCYQNWQRYAAIHYMALSKGACSILWSCSIDPEVMDEEMLSVLKGHHMITAREDITYGALTKRGLSNVIKVTDIAFTLKTTMTELPAGDFVAVNFGPLIIRKNALVKNAIERLIDFILEETNLNVALVPHVLAVADNDYEALCQVKIRDGCRMTLISDRLSAAQYKYIISKARFGIFARTHAAIAAYSSEVPSLAIGYSSKSKGIAADLNMSEYVIDAGLISDSEDIVNEFKRLMQNELAIRTHLAEKIPRYIDNAINKDVLQIITKLKK